MMKISSPSNNDALASPKAGSPKASSVASSRASDASSSPGTPRSEGSDLESVSSNEDVGLFEDFENRTKVTELLLR